MENKIQRLKPSIEIKWIADKNWTGFKFITKKKGAYGPTKEECLEYYEKRLVLILKLWTLWILQFYKLYLSALKGHIVNLTITADHGRYSWIDSWEIFEVSRDGFQTLTIPVSGEYKIEIVAPGSNSSVPGARILGTFKFEKGQKITAALG